MTYNIYAPSYNLDITEWEMNQIFDIVDIEDKKMVVKNNLFQIKNKNTYVIISFSGHLDILSNILTYEEITLLKWKIENYLKSRYVLFQYKQL